MRERSFILKKKLDKIFFIFKFIPKVEFFCLLILLYIFILVAGTIEQKSFGLHFIQEAYFNSNFTLLFGVFPMFGGKLIFFLVFFSLVFRLCSDKWNKKRMGTIIIHLGVLFLIFGSFINNLFKIEGYLNVRENNFNNIFVFNDLYDLNFLNKKSKKTFYGVIDINIKNKSFTFDGDTLNINVFSSNCVLFKKTRFLNKSQAYGINRFFTIKDFPSFVEQEENKQFLSFNVSNIGSDKKIFVIDNNESLIYEDDFMKINLSKKNEVLPFNLYLSKFEKVNYIGTQKAKNYVSNLIIENNNITWKTIIEMNKPLRVGNYTLYQTSFLDGDEKSTILTVVENACFFYPYVSTFLIFLGFFIHLLTSFKRIRTKNE